MSDVHARLHNDILWLLLDRQPLNPLTVEMLGKLTAAMQRAVTPRLIVITGMGERAFCTGVDLPDGSETQRTALLQAAGETEAAFTKLALANIPTVALVKGSAFAAGCELVSLCNTVIAREDATFRLPEVNARVFPNAVSLHLPALIGQETTTRLIRNGETLSAREALHIGLVHQVLPARRFSLDSEELLVMLASLGKLL